MNHNITDRKDAHLALSLLPQMRGNRAALDNIHLCYEADFPISNNQLNTHVSLCGKTLDFPLIIGSMTGGTPNATLFNNTIRKLANRYQIALGLGSIRAALANPDLITTYGNIQAPLVIGNIGISEVMQGTYSISYISETLEKLGCHALYVHLNIIQEWLQPGGDYNLHTDIDRLANFINNIRIPVLIKEVGSGIGGACAERLARLNIAGIETASLGGTSWVKIEASRRTNNNTLSIDNINALNQIGVPLETAIRDCRASLKNRTVIASGGIHDALTIVKSLAIGADAVSIAQPIYEVFKNTGEDGLDHWLSEMISVARLIWRSTGAKDINGLRTKIV